MGNLESARAMRPIKQNEELQKILKEGETRILNNEELQPILAIVNDTLGLEALHDNIIVKEDKFRTGYECKTCDGYGHSDVVCTKCNGERTELIDDRCTVCEGVGKVLDLFRPMPGTYTPGIEINPVTKEPEQKYRDCKNCGGSGKDPDFKNRRLEPGLYPCRACICVDMSGNARPSGFMPCSICKGRGVSVLIPEDAVLRPNSGVVISVGINANDCKSCKGSGGIPGFATCKKCEGTGQRKNPIKAGDRILYSNHTGMAIQFKRNIVFRWMREDEIPIQMHGIGRIHESLL